MTAAAGALAATRQRTGHARSALRDHACLLWPIVQVGVCAVGVAAYFAVRSLTEGRPEAAFRNAARLQAWEGALGLPHELVLQQAVLESEALTRLLGWVYVFGHWPVIAVVLSWLLARHRDVFRRARDAMLASGLAGVGVFATFPVAPPRLLDAGLVDTVAGSTSAYRVLQPAVFTNQYAAMPSLHVGWNLLVGLAVWVAGRRLWLRVLAVAMPLVMAVAVVLTANHYLVDVVAGVLLAGGAWLLGTATRTSQSQMRAAAPSSASPSAGVRGAGTTSTGVPAAEVTGVVAGLDAATSRTTTDATSAPGSAAA
jgi:membrane-associated phospholipid phosphatase